MTKNENTWGESFMPERVHEHLVILLYAIAAISGGLGGCTVAANRLLSGRSMRMSFFLAYAIIGVVFGVLTAAYGTFIVNDSPADIIGPAIISGIVGSIALSGANLTARFILQRLGVEVQITVKRKEETGRGKS